MTFVLEKWYADCVTQKGSVIIAYAASLRWLGLGFSYSGAIDDNGRVGGRLRLGRRLDLEPDSPSWSFLVAERTGRRCLRWETLQAAPAVAPLLDLPQGRVEWSPLALAANVFESTTPALIGVGYLERLRLTLRPWRIGLRALHWGRWIGRRRALTWVEWEGRYPRRGALLDGQYASLATVDDTGITLGNGARLRFGTARILVDAKLGKDALRIWSYLPGLIPRRFLDGVERKYVAKAVLTSNNQIDEGWAIYEKVNWPE